MEPPGAVTTQSAVLGRASASVSPSVSASGIPGKRTSHQPFSCRSSVYRYPNAIIRPPSRPCSVAAGRAWPMPLRRGLQPAVKPVLAFPPAAPHLWSGRDRTRESGRVGMGMAYLPAAHRALDVITPVVIYRQIGRRPSQVYVNDAMGDATPDKKAQHRLRDRVYWRNEAKTHDPR